MQQNYVNAANICNRKIKDNEELESATKLAQQEEIARLQRLQEIQEQLWQQAAMDLRLYKQNEVTLTSPVSTEPPAVKSEASVALPTTASPLLPNSSDTGAYCFDSFITKYLLLNTVTCKIVCHEVC